MASKHAFHCPFKQQARQTIWKELAWFKPPSQAKVLLLPGSTRYELDVVMGRGYLPGNIFIVERNSAALANLTRRYKNEPFPPKGNILRMELSDAVNELKTRGVILHVAHLDFCQNCQRGDIQKDVHHIVDSGILAEDSLLALTLLAERENRGIEELQYGGWTFDILHSDPECAAAITYKSLSMNDRGRIRKMWEALGLSVQISVRQFGRYRNSETYTSMLWVIFRLQKTQPKESHTRSLHGHE